MPMETDPESRSQVCSEGKSHVQNECDALCSVRSFLLLVAMPGAPSSYLLLVACYY